MAVKQNSFTFCAVPSFGTNSTFGGNGGQEWGHWSEWRIGTSLLRRGKIEGNENWHLTDWQGGMGHQRIVRAAYIFVGCVLPSGPTIITQDGMPAAEHMMG